MVILCWPNIHQWVSQELLVVNGHKISTTAGQLIADLIIDSVKRAEQNLMWSKNYKTRWNRQITVTEKTCIHQLEKVLAVSRWDIHLWSIKERKKHRSHSLPNAQNQKAACTDMPSTIFHNSRTLDAACTNLNPYNWKQQQKHSKSNFQVLVPQ